MKLSPPFFYRDNMPLAKIRQLGESHSFRTEEAFILELGLPNDEYQAHLAAHNSIIEELAQIHLDAMYGKYQALPEVIANVANWVQQHLVEFDLALKPYIAGRSSTLQS